MIDGYKFLSVIDDNQLPPLVFGYDRFLVYYFKNVCSILFLQSYPAPWFPPDC